MTMTKKEIEQMQQELAWALKQADEAKAEVIGAEKAYDDKFEPVVNQFERDHQELTQMRTDAQEASRIASDKAAVLRKKAVDKLENYFTNVNAEAKPATGFSMRMEKAPEYDYDDLLGAAVKKGATFLLRLDEKAIKKFVIANAEKDGTDWVMPDYLRKWLPALWVDTVQKPLISDKTLIQDAPDTEPDNTPVGSPF